MPVYSYIHWKEVEDKLKPVLDVIENWWQDVCANNSDYEDTVENPILDGSDPNHYIIGKVLELKKKWLHKEKIQSEYMKELQHKIYRILGESEGVVEETLYDILQEVHTELCIHNVARQYIPEETIELAKVLTNEKK